ncbi:aldehyde dehydrogenase family protein [Sneathiella chinensis]|nr:aldehyde dehydrogenase family protein [Sneathiella chinensis]
MAQELKKYWQNYIDGQWVDGVDGERIAIENPATAEHIADVARATQADVDLAVAAARRCYNSRELYNMRPTNRGILMFEIARHLTEMADEIALAECLDNGKTLTGGRNEALAAARYFTYYGGLADKLEGRMIPLGADYVDYTIPSPFGVSAQIVPWNFPLQIAARSVACALATANTVVLKSPELSPLSTYFIAEACHRAGVPKGAVNILCGFGHDCGAYLSAHPDVDHIVFTGSLKTGQSILRAAAERVLPCVMELGGKSAGILFKDADVDQAINSSAAGIFSNAGQVCSAQSRLIVPTSLHDQVIEKLVAKVASLSIGPGIEEHNITPVISGPQADKIDGMCLAALQAGAEAATGGGRAEGMAGHFIKPTVFTNLTPDMTIAREEVFGPVLSILTYDDPEEALTIANGTDYGLCAGVYTRDLATAHWAADRLVAGQVFVNEWFAGGIETPFGGTKRSGYGREKGQEALLNYVQTKNVGIRITDGGGGRPGG